MNREELVQRISDLRKAEETTRIFVELLLLIHQDLIEIKELFTPKHIIPGRAEE